MRRLERNEQDLENTYWLLTKMHEQVGFDVGRLVPERVIAQIVFCIEHGAVFVEELDGAIVGAIGLRPDSPWWSDFEFLIDGFFYVVPEVRHTGVAKRLLKAAQAFAASKGLPLYVQITTGVDLDRKEKFFARFGFEARGALMEWRP